MSRVSNAEQFKFLISCIRYSNNGKVDFGHVAKECKIVSKGAAAKRYERMMKSHGIAPNAASIKPAPLRNTMKNERRESGSSATKKRKMDAFPDEGNPVDDDEGGYASNIKNENGGWNKEQLVVKEEGEQIGQLNLNEAVDLMQYYDFTASYEGGAEEEQMGVEKTYTTDDMGAGNAASSSNAYSMQSSQPADFSLPYGSMESSSIPRSYDQDVKYQPPAQDSMTDQGGCDSPVILE